MVYLIETKPYHYFMGAECEPTFKIEVIKEYWSWKAFNDVRETVLTVEKRDWWVAVQEVNKYITENKIQNEVIYPEWYRFLKYDN